MAFGGASALVAQVFGTHNRIEALGGTFSVRSPAGGGTTVSCELPVSGDAGQPGAGPGQ